MAAVWGVIAGLIALALLVVLHELGHAWQARRCGVVVEEFGIGMPPAIWKKKLKSGIILSFNWLLFGGFVKLQGEYDEADKKGDYGAASFWSKTRILFAGVIANTLFAVVVITAISLFGLPKVVDNQFNVASDSTVVRKPVQVVSVVKESAAQKAGLKPGDHVTSFAAIKIKTDEQLDKLIDSKKSQTVVIGYTRGGVDKESKVTLGSDIEKGYLGIGMQQREYIRSTWSAPVVGVVTTAQFTWETAKGVFQLIGDLVGGVAQKFSPNIAVRDSASQKLKSVGDSVAGPVGIVGTIFPAAEQAGFTQIALLTAIISISLAVMNLLPIPTLDGGRWSTMAIFKLFRKKLTIRREEKIQTVGFMIMITLAILVTVLDVKKIF